MSKLQTGDIVRFVSAINKRGLHEVTGYSANGEVTLTNDECNSEFYAIEEDLILVCPKWQRRDL